MMYNVGRDIYIDLEYVFSVDKFEEGGYSEEEPVLEAIPPNVQEDGMFFDEYSGHWSKVVGTKEVYIPKEYGINIELTLSNNRNKAICFNSVHERDTAFNALIKALNEYKKNQ